MHPHYVEECVHGIVHGQCRCPHEGKTVRIVPCNHPMPFSHHEEKTIATPQHGVVTNVDGYAQSLCTACEATIRVPIGEDEVRASLMALELHLYHRIQHHEEEK